MEAVDLSVDVPAIVVAGVSSGAGKTAVAETVVRILAREYQTAAAKITVTHGERGCPHGGKGCDVCSSLGGDYQVIRSRNIIEQRGTDTARLAAAGATPVLWTITRENFIKEAWQKMLIEFATSDCVVVESNTLAEVINPALCLMLVDPSRSRKIWKPSAMRLIQAADELIFNDRGTERQRADLLQEIQKMREGKTPPRIVQQPEGIQEHQEILRSIERVMQGRLRQTRL